MYGSVHVPFCTCESQRTTYKGWFSLFTSGTWRTNPGCQACKQEPFTILLASQLGIKHVFLRANRETNNNGIRNLVNM